MKALYDAIEKRYETDVKLKELTFAIYRGFEDVKVRSGAPYAVLEIEDVEILDTFTSDVERHSIRIVYYSGKPQPDRALLWLEEIVNAFADASMADGFMQTADVREVRRSGPTVDGETKTYRAEVTFDVYVQRGQPLPLR